MYKSAYIFGVVVTLLTVSCSSEKAKNSQNVAVSPEPAPTAVNHTPAIIAETHPASTPYLTEAALPKDLVCMVNNAYMGKKQFPVQFEDKLYYGCCQMCVKTIQNERSVRVAIDPLSQKEVDKSVAFITLNPVANDGSVLYFESEENYKKYMDQKGRI